MADNVLYTQGTGTSVATDDVGGIHFQKFKLDVGGDGSTLQPAGSIPVYIVSGTGAYLMNDTFIDAVAIAGQFDDTGTTAAIEDKVAPLRITSQRGLHINLRSAAGAELSTPGNPLIVSGSATLMGYDDLPNSTSTILGANAVFSGVAFDTLNYPAFVCIVASDQNSATGGISFQWSQNGLNWDVTSSSDVVGGTGRGFHINHRGRYFRVVYTNGGTAQVQFRLDTIHRMSSAGIITRPLDDVLNTENFAEISRSIINAQKPDTTFGHLQQTASTNLKISIEEINPITIISGSMVGNVPHDGIDVGNPIKVGGFVHSGLPVPALTGDRANILLDVYGRPRIIFERKPILGNYKFESGRLTVQAAAHGSTAGFFWFVNPVGSPVTATVKKLFAMSGPSANGTFASAPRVTTERVTFTGSASGATITPALRDSKDAAPICSIRTASTGLTLTAGATAGDFSVPTVISGAWVGNPVNQWFYDYTDEDDYLVIRAGEGFVIRQPDAGSTGDTRLLLVFGSWEEK